MNKWKIGGVVGIVLGSVALFYGGASESEVAAIVGGVFVLFGVISAIIKK
jgi:FtsH-binding integral membrane protein